MSNIRSIASGWSFTQVGGGQGTKDGEYLPVSEFPTTVHVELLKLKKIPDPFLGLNEWEVQWIGETEWVFKNTFTVTEKDLAADHADLVFEGLDTYATVKLNDQKILNTENQFITYRAPVKQLLKIGSNDLVISFASAFKKGRELEKANGKFHLWNGDSSRLHVRKAQYNYGWDWGPILMTVGPWKPINLHTYNVYLADVDIRSAVSEALDVKVTVDLTLSEKSSGSASVTLKNPQGGVVHTEKNLKVESGNARAEFKFSSGELDLWYPVHYGKQPLYTVEVAVSDANGTTLDLKTETVAFRRVRVVEEPLVDQPGKTFLFEVNNVRIFCGGSNWIPADSFLTTMTSERYRDWLQLLIDGNQNMIRVWGGGIYEADAFYDICDELGILVWQDFMFGCGQYPAYDSFLKLVEVEAEQNVKRLRHHPSVVIFAGNNEDYQLAESIKVIDYADETSDFRKTKFPARYIYERTLPSIVGKLCDIHYHRSSPYSAPGVVSTDKTLGDLHQWNVWHGSQEPWHNWDILAGRFVSEFGMEGYPNIRTVDYWLGGDQSERYPQSRVNNNHNKADGFERRLELYLVENFKHAFDMDSYVYYTQVMQAETLASAYRLWRRNWRGKGREHTAGALVWQINDCWPTTSWAIVDYFLRPKPAFFTIARELRPFTVGMTRKEKKTFLDELSAASFTIETILEVWGTNSTLTEKKAKLEVSSFDLHSSWTDKFTQDIVLAPNSSTELFSGQLPGQPIRTKQSEVPRVIIVSARLLDESGTVLGRYSNWPEPFKFIDFPAIKDLGLIVKTGSDGESVELSTQKPIKGIILDVEGEDVKWSDQAIDLVPGDSQIIKAVGLKGREVKARFLGDGTA
ncbi:glycoside hydrolase family 2 protein [Hydnomerulius pinastri MD-312]|nr:glycoside hydrolase family 2 protein [Hydnomerulius pinastri MD-312]